MAENILAGNDLDQIRCLPIVIVPQPGSLQNLRGSELLLPREIRVQVGIRLDEQDRNPGDDSVSVQLMIGVVRLHEVGSDQVIGITKNQEVAGSGLNPAVPSRRPPGRFLQGDGNELVRGAVPT
ncbi:hypothetical protein D3C74_411830 [compost metagenome]